MNWFDNLQPASFNGVPFYVDATERKGGRRLVTSEYPLRDDAYNEDLGGVAKSFQVTAYLVADDFVNQRAALEYALDNSSTAGTLVHPTYGRLRVWVGETRSKESRSAGNYVTIEIPFTLDGGAASPITVTDTASALLDSVAAIGSFIETAYTNVLLIPAVLGAAASRIARQLGQAVDAFGAMPQATIAGISVGFAANPSDPVGTASGVVAAFTAAAANVVAAQTVPVSATSAVLGSLGAVGAPADPSGGLLALTGFGATLPAPPAMALPALGQAQNALVTLITGAALMAVVTVYASAEWPDAQAALAALDNLQDLLDAQVQAAADVGNYDLFRAWRAISAQAVADMRQRAQNLPQLANYALAGSVPSLVLAQALYQDASQADALVALNAAPHPLFMPASGFYLQAA